MLCIKHGLEICRQCEETNIFRHLVSSLKCKLQQKSQCFRNNFLNLLLFLGKWHHDACFEAGHHATTSGSVQFSAFCQTHMVLIHELDFITENQWLWVFALLKTGSNYGKKGSRLPTSIVQTWQLCDCPSHCNRHRKEKHEEKDSINSPVSNSHQIQTVEWDNAL